MQFIDLALIHIRSGAGGSGCTSFRREKFIEFGGPDGGDGGKGGDVIVKAISNLNTLVDFNYKRHYFAKNGRPGMGQNKTGANGDDVIINVPVGTEVLLENKKTVLVDLVNDGQRYVIAEGGNGGWGNSRFKSSTRSTRTVFLFSNNTSVPTGTFIIISSPFAPVLFCPIPGLPFLAK